MRHVSLMAAAGILMLWLGGCATGPAGDTTATQSPPVATTPAPGAVPAPPTAQSPAPGTPPNQPEVAVSPRPAGNLPPDLISSTDADQRLRTIQRNRPDPFALVPTTPIVERTEEPEPAPVAAPAQPVTNIPPPDLAPIPELVPAAPPLPQAELARAVEVSGVVQVGDTVHAIVRAPNEPTSRYVRVGQYLSNGQVLVKRIEVNRAEPVVVLEQDGVEVVTAVGEGGTPDAIPGSPTAAAIAPILAASLW